MTDGADAFRWASMGVVLGLTLAGAALAFPISIASQDLATTNDGPAGATVLSDLLEAEAARNGAPPPQAWQEDLEDLPAPTGPGQASLLILAPEQGTVGDAEIDAIEAFLDGGGTVVLADDTGAANGLLTGLGTQTRVTGNELIDLAYSRQPTFPVLYSIQAHPMTQGIATLVANAASTVAASPNTTVLVASSSSAWLDMDGDGSPSQGDQRGTFPVLTRERVGAGELYVLSDPSLVSNEMIDEADNRVLALNMGQILTAGGATLHVDESHRDHRPFALLAGAIPGLDGPWRVVALAVLISIPLSALGGLRALETGLMWLAGRLEPDQDPLETVLEEHPDWDEQTLRDLQAYLSEAQAPADDDTRTNSHGR